jgi:hypothetical protein
MTTSGIIMELMHTATLDDISFDIVLDAWRDTQPPPTATLNDLLDFIGQLLDVGFVPVTPPPSTDWPEKDRQAIFDRITRAWEALTEEPTFLDICWFHLPPERHPAPL